jgi:peroxiredoxin
VVSSFTERARIWWWRWAAALSIAVVLALWPVWATPDETPTDGGKPLAANLSFTLKDMHGADVRLADFRGRPIVLNFWATWCGPCLAEIPVLNAIADAYRAQRLAVLGISVDDAPDDLRRFAVDHKMSYPLLVGRGHDKMQEAYDAVMYVPITWLIRADGTIFLKHEGPATREWFDTQIKSLVASATEPE